MGDEAGGRANGTGICESGTSIAMEFVEALTAGASVSGCVAGKGNGEDDGGTLSAGMSRSAAGDVAISFFADLCVLFRLRFFRVRGELPWLPST